LRHAATCEWEELREPTQPYRGAGRGAAHGLAIHPLSRDVRTAPGSSGYGTIARDLPGLSLGTAGVVSPAGQPEGESSQAAQA
jgi:hypothetical protein